MVVQTEHAFYWECPKCKNGNFLRGIIPTLESDEEREQAKEILVELGTMDIYQDLTPELLEELVMCPLKLTCGECNSEFDSIDKNEQSIE